MRALVLGGLGFLGGHLVDALRARGELVRIADHSRPEGAVLAGVEWHLGDLNGTPDWAALAEGCRVVYHLGWSTIPQTSNDDPIADARTNVIGTLRLLDAVKGRRDLRLVFVSSGGTVYGRAKTVPIPETHPTNPTTAYGISKLTVEKYLYLYGQLQGLDYCVLRVANLFGPGQDVTRNLGAVTTFLNRALADEPITIWGDGTVVRDYIYVSDVVAALIAAAEHLGPWPDDMPVFNIGSGVGQSLNAIVKALQICINKPVQVTHEPARPFDVPISVLDITKARTELGWAPRLSFIEALNLTIQALKG